MKREKLQSKSRKGSKSAKKERHTRRESIEGGKMDKYIAIAYLL